MSSALTVFLPACVDISTAFLAIDYAISSITLLSSFADSSLTRSAPDFFRILYMGESPNSDDFMIIFVQSMLKNH